MKINLKVLQDLFPTFGVEAVQSKPGVQQVADSGNTDKAPAKYEPILTGAGYEWSDEKNAYVAGDQTIYFVELGNVFIWIWNGLFRGLKGSTMLQKWVQGNEKYPEGKANQFMGTYKQTTGQSDDGGGVATSEPEQDEPEVDRSVGGGDVTFTGTGTRDVDPKPIDPTDMLISKLKKQAGFAKKLPSNLMIDLGTKAKADKNEKLLAFLKTVQPIMENKIKRSQLDTLVREIVKGIVKEGFGDYQGLKGSGNDQQLAQKIAQRVWGGTPQYNRSKSAAEGTVYQFDGSRLKRTPSKFLWKTPTGQWRALDLPTRKWKDISPQIQDFVREMTGTGAVAGFSTPNAFKKTKGTMEEGKIQDPSKEEMVNYLRSQFGNEEGFDGDAEAAMYWFANFNHGGQASNLYSVLSTSQFRPGPISRGPQKGSAEEMMYQSLVHQFGDPSLEDDEEQLDEITTTGAVDGYNVPGAFAKKGGSHRGIEGSEALGYTLTPQGKKEMHRKADKLTESQFGSNFDKAQRAHDAQSPDEEEGTVTCDNDECGKEAQITGHGGRKGGTWWWKAKCNHCGNKMSGDNI